MDAQFNTELEDNSCIEVAKELLRFHHYCLEGNTNTIKTEIEKLLPLQKWIEPRNPNSNTVRVNENESSSEEESMDVETSNEWTEVRTRRKR